MSNRTTLKTFFQKGDFPTEAQFEDLIDQTVNIENDVPPINFNVTLSSAQILTLFTTPITVIPAQGADTVIQVLSITAKLIFGATAYTIPGFSKLQYHETNLAGSKIAEQQAGFVASVADAIEKAEFEPLYTTMLPDVPVVAANTVGNPTLGDGTIEINLLAQVIQF